jgi:hypothetical protein
MTTSANNIGQQHQCQHQITTSDDNIKSHNQTATSDEDIKLQHQMTTLVNNI